MKLAKSELDKAKLIENTNFKILESIMLDAHLAGKKLGIRKDLYQLFICRNENVSYTFWSYVCPYLRLRR